MSTILSNILPMIGMVFMLCLTFLACIKTYKEPSISLPEGFEIVDIPFHYSHDGDLVTEVVACQDTFRFIIDTGADKSIVTSNVGGVETGKIITVYDILRIKRVMPEVRVDLLSWADINLKNFAFGKFDFRDLEADGIIGGDILRNFIVKFDNAKKIMSLTMNPDSIQVKGKRVPFTFKNNRIELKVDIESQSIYFNFDTGINIEFLLDSTSFASLNAKSIIQTVWLENIGSPFMKEACSELDTLVNNMFNYLVLEKTFLNGIFFHCGKINTNLIGTAFLRRFRCVTIDYVNANIYFQLPEDNSIMKFSGKVIKEVPTAYLQILYGRINSFGIQYRFEDFITIRALKTLEIFEPLQIGDTLVGVNNSFFDEKSFHNLERTEKENVRQMVASSDKWVFLHKVLSRESNATFHFLKNGQIISINKSREERLKSPPQWGYSFSSADAGMDFFPIKLPIEGNIRPYIFLHFPWSTLTGEEIKISTYTDGKETKLTNNPNDKFFKDILNAHED